MCTSFNGLLKGGYRFQLQNLRYKSKIRITHPKPPHYRRAVVEQVCVPFFVKNRTPVYTPKYENCEITFHPSPKPPVDNPYLRILAKEMLNWLNNSKLIAIFHQNFMDEEDVFEHFVKLKKAGFKALTYHHSVVKESVVGTVYEPIYSFYQSHTVLGVSVEPNLSNLIKVRKEVPLLILMGAIVNNNRLLEVKQLEKWAKLNNIEQARMELIGILNRPQVDLVNQLNYHPNALVQSLRQIKNKEKKTENKVQ